MVITLSDGSTYPCSFFGYSSMFGFLYIDLPNMSMAEAFKLFSDEAKIKKITYKLEDDSNENATVKTGFTNLIGVEKTDSGDGDAIRVTLRKPFVEEEQ